MPRIIIKIVKKQFAYKKYAIEKTNGISCIKKRKRKNIAAKCPFKICVTYSFIFTKEEKKQDSNKCDCQMKFKTIFLWVISFLGYLKYSTAS